MRHLKSSVCAVLFVLSILSAARAETYTGRLEGVDAFIAVITEGDKAVAYVCNGQTLAQWFRGKRDKVPLELPSTDQMSRLTLRISLQTVTGNLRLLDGGIYKFKALRSSGSSGLYRSETLQDGVNYTGGWVLLENGEQRGSIMGGGPVRPAGLMRLQGGVKAALEGVGELSPFTVNEAWVSSRVR